MSWRLSEMSDFERTQKGLRDKHFGDVLNAYQAERARYRINETGQLERKLETDTINWQEVDERIKWEKENS